MHQIVIHIAGPEPVKLLPEHLLRSVPCLQHIVRQLCRNIYLLPDSVLFQNLSEGSFTSGIDICRIKVIYTAFIGRHNLLLRLLYVNLPCLL